MAAVRTAYKRLLKKGRLQPDPAQAAAAEALARLEERLARARPGLIPFLKPPPAPKGLYLWGPPGRGKSMLMDLFFEHAPVTLKRRAHFHAFMAEVHGLIAAWRDGDAKSRKRRFGAAKGDDPVGPTADVIASQARLLCFDEFQVTDIADAMILGRLFDALFERRVVLVATSNRAPEGLYENGLNRQLFLPFVDRLRERCEVLRVDGPRDFRLDRLKGARVYFSPRDAAAAQAFDALWRELVGEDREAPLTLQVQGRDLTLPRAAAGMARADFDALCARPLGPQDYLTLARAVHTLFLEDVPRLGPEKRNEAKRFVTLVDALYEAGGKLVLLAEAEPDDLYPRGDGAFEFERTASRLQEMRSASWLDRARADG